MHAALLHRVFLVWEASSWGRPFRINYYIMSRQSLTNKQYFLPFVLVTSLFFLWGFARAILDVLNKHFQNELDISITQSSLIQVTTYLGYFAWVWCLV